MALLLADQIFGRGGNDTLIGYDGDDVLEGGKGADEQFGSFGFDYVSYRSSGGGVAIDLNSGECFGGDAQGDRLYSIEGAFGTGYTDHLHGSDERNILRGEAGADYLVGYGGNDLLAGGGGNDLLRSGMGADELRGDAGTDYALYSGSGQAVTVDLAAGKGFGGEAEGDRFVSVEGVLGSSLGDRITGNAAANQLFGAYGADLIAGGGGADQFFYSGAGDSSVATSDRILDFSRSQGDRIVVGTMDANDEVDGRQAFQFIGKSAFSDAGQLRWYQQNGDTIIEGNTTDATTGAELRIVLDPVLNLQASDFIFADIGFGPPIVG